MSARSLAVMLLSLCVALPAMASTTTMDQWGTFASAAVNLKSSLGSDVWTPVTSDSSGNYFEPISSVALSAPSYDAQAWVLTGMNPQIKVYCRADGSNRALAEAFAAEGLTYTGSASRTVTMDIALAGTLDKTPAGAATSFDTQLTCEVWVFPAEGFRLTHNAMDLWLYQGLAPLDWASLNILDEGVTEATGQLSFDVEPGDRMYVWYKLKGIATLDGAEADAWNTLSISLDDPAEFAAASPEPGSMAVFAAGIAAVLRRRR